MIGRTPRLLRVMVGSLSGRVAALCVAAVPVAGLSVLSLSSAASAAGMLPSALTVGDGVVWLFLGSASGLAPDWMAPWAIVLAAVACGSFAPWGSVGEDLLLRSGDSRGMALSRCLASLVVVLAALLVTLLADACWVLALGGGAGLSTSCAAEASYWAVAPSDASGVLAFLGVVVAGCAALSQVGVLLDVTVGGPSADVVLAVLLVTSGVFWSAPLPGSWLMASRCLPLATAPRALPPEGGLALFAALGLGSVAAVLRLGGRRDRSRRVAAALLGSSRLSLALACAVAVAVALAQSASLVALAAAEGVGVPCLADLLAFVTLGMPQLHPQADVAMAAQQLRIPFGWLCLVLSPAVAAFAVARAASGSEGILVASGSRRAFWRGSCLAVAAAVLLVWVGVLLACALVALGVGGGLGMTASPWFPDVAGLDRATLAGGPYGCLAMLASMVAASVALALAQLALSSLTGPVPAFCLSALALAASVFAATPALPGNLLMSSRSTVFCSPVPVAVEHGQLAPGVPPALALAWAAAAGAASSLLGAVALARSSRWFGGVR